MTNVDVCCWREEKQSMTELVLNAGRILSQTANDRVYPNRWRLGVLAIIAFFFFVTPATHEATLVAMRDAFLQVSVFVATTLALVYWFEKQFSFDLGEVMANNARWQPLIASLLGALPGCGGAIIVVTQFTRGYASFGAFIAVLVSTMGDAAFLLLAREPKTALLVIVISVVAGTITGMIVDIVHGRDYLANDQKASGDIGCRTGDGTDTGEKFNKIWIALIAVGSVFGLMVAFQADPEELFGAYAFLEPVKWFAFIGASLSLFMWATARNQHSQIGADSVPGQPLLTRVVKDTNFVTSWVVVAFLGFEICISVFGFDLGAQFETIAILVPAIAILIGFIPGCGPQIIVTSLYLAGAVPFSAQIANGIANDGDALFPALALVPRAAILATLYSAIPAVLIGYTFYFSGY